MLSTEELRDIELAFRSLKLAINNLELKIKKLHPKQTPALLKETRELYIDKLCKYCLKNDRNIVFLPCRHWCCCDICNETAIRCKLCECKIENYIKTFQ